MRGFDNGCGHERNNGHIGGLCKTDHKTCKTTDGGGLMPPKAKRFVVLRVDGYGMACMAQK